MVFGATGATAPGRSRVGRRWPRRADSIAQNPGDRRRLDLVQARPASVGSVPEPRALGQAPGGRSRRRSPVPTTKLPGFRCGGEILPRGVEPSQDTRPRSRPPRTGRPGRRRRESTPAVEDDPPRRGRSNLRSHLPPVVPPSTGNLRTHVRSPRCSQCGGSHGRTAGPAFVGDDREPEPEAQDRPGASRSSRRGTSDDGRSSRPRYPRARSARCATPVAERPASTP